MKMHRTFLAIAVAIACSTSSVQAVQPPDIVLTPLAGGGVSVTNAAGTVTHLRIAEDGSVTIPGSIFKGARQFLHNFGTGNTFLGDLAGNFTMTGANNTGSGVTALASNTTGAANTAIGSATLGNNTTGEYNTAIGALALGFNTTGGYNTANGAGALVRNTTGGGNVAVGQEALKENLGGSGNTVLGASAAVNNRTAHFNTAVGGQALFSNVAGVANIAVGYGAGTSITGSRNIAIGNGGDAGEDGTIRIGNESNQTRTFIAGIRGKTTGSANAIPVMIDGSGQLGTVSSSGRFKDDIADMASSTDALMKLRPVTFHYKADQDPAGRTLQYGLIAEEVAEVYPGLVAYSADGQVETVMYQFLPSMLLNQVQKQQRMIDAQAAELAALRGTLAVFERRLERLGRQ